MTAAGFYDVLAIEDPDYRRSEALSLEIVTWLEEKDEHPIVCISALAHAIIGYLSAAPAKHRNDLTDSLLADIRRMVRLDA